MSALRYQTHLRTAIALATMNAIGLAAFVAFAGSQSEQRRMGGPSDSEVQKAYDQAAADAREAHDEELKVIHTECRRSEGVSYSCRVDFVRAAPDASQVFLDMALVERQKPEGWRLLKGLCRNLR